MDIYNQLWQNSEAVAKQTLQTEFLQHMQRGDLQAENYVNFMIQDINYLVKVRDMLEKMSKKEAPDDVKKFLNDRYNSYKTFAVSMLKEFNLKGVSDVKATPAMEKYLSDYKAIMEEDSIYFIVALLPCNRLWVWLANHLRETCCNAYFTWKMDNKDGHPEKYRPVLDKYLKTKEQKEKADKIFRKQMKNEHDFFETSFIKDGLCPCTAK